jgi:hypothetical protein
MMGALGTDLVAGGETSAGWLDGDAPGRAGEAAPAVSRLMSGADRPSIIDLPTAPTMTATLHTAYSIILRERTVVSLFILAATRCVTRGTPLAAQAESASLHYRGVGHGRRQGTRHTELHRNGLLASLTH